ncbi:acyl-CoA dehydrogenase family protein [Streptomyces phyllanthi]|uniref:Medium-chain specific acyl-CoA dehydrogenase, mitochondrial n=1 Tax=Streptomyces phyllanthi TaxID=1803180 RepID=A0A5N8W510_9ACTN|nr:acyl-CoA dehydrogenase family protein [Streptomyces phyllanthi]MPY41404.1 acyl-CoA dehydrogenase family protein [Streptomyces phyllanthi]
MDFSLSPRLGELKERAVDLARKIKEYEDECEARNGLSAQSRDALRQTVLASGLQAMNAPVEWGGAGFGWSEQVVVEEELGTLTNGLWAAVWRPTAAALLACTPEQRERYLIPENRGERFGARAITEPDAGSDPRRIATVARRTGDGYRISGEKWFVTLGDVADYLLVLAVVQPDAAPTMFLVDKDTPGVRMTATPHYTHNFAYEHPHFVLDEVEVGPEAVLGEVGGGLALVQATFFEERVLVAAHAVGAAERALGLAADWARERVQGGRPIIEHQLIQAMLADSATDIALNRTLVYRLAWEIDQGGDMRTLSAKVAMAKLSATEAAGRVVDRAVQIFGGRGYVRDNPVERLYRDVRVDRIWMGTSEVQRLMIAKEIDKRGLPGLLRFPVAYGTEGATGTDVPDALGGSGEALLEGAGR